MTGLKADDIESAVNALNESGAGSGGQAIGCECQCPIYLPDLSVNGVSGLVLGFPASCLRRMVLLQFPSTFSIANLTSIFSYPMLAFVGILPKCAKCRLHH